jgi:glyoxylase-like metal-dependent hydrolase (beta-lactamase superfamily II)
MREAMPAFLTWTRGWRTVVFASAGSALIAVVVFGCWRWHSTSLAGSFSKDRVQPLVRDSVRVAPGLYMIGSLSPSAVYVVDTSDGLILVDSGLDRDAAPLKSEMTKLGLDWKRVRKILISHAHGDHSGGAESLRGATGATVYAGEGDALVLAAGGPREAFFSTFYMPDQPTHPTTVDVALKGGETIALGDVRIQVLDCPGHTPGSMCYLMERDNYHALFAGDVIMMLRGDDEPRNELGKPLGTYSAYLSARYRGDAQAYLESLRRLRAMPVPDLILPGHPRADVIPQSPCLSQKRWQSLLGQGIDDLEKVLSRHKADGADFLDGTPKQLLRDLYYLGEFRGSSVYGLFASSGFYLVDAPGGPGLIDYVSSRLRNLGREPSLPKAVLLTACDKATTAGLKEIVEKCASVVVASTEGIDTLKASLPAATTFIQLEDLPGKSWFPVVAIPLRARGIAPAAYELSWDGKKVLCSGRIPLVITQETGKKLIEDLTSAGGDVRGYAASIFELRERKPDLWLPATPTNDQNANLYEREWAVIIEDNLSVINFIVSTGEKR